MSERAASSLSPVNPQKAKYLKSLIDLAEKVTAREEIAPFWQRDESLVTDSWGRVLDASFVALAELRENRSLSRGRWAEIEKDLALTVAQAQAQALAPGLSRREVMLAEQAEVSLGQARRLAQRGEADRALKLADIVHARATEVRKAWDALHARFDDGATLRQWRSLVDSSIAQSVQQNSNVLVVDKLRRRLDVYVRGNRIDSFPIELGSRGLKRKLHSGDKATPEGRYRVLEVRRGGQTRFYKALLLDYPNSEDRQRYADARRHGQIPAGAGIGALIEIHGDGGRGKDWTDGCIALTNTAMDRLFRYASVNMPVVIVGTVQEGKKSR